MAPIPSRRYLPLLVVLVWGGLGPAPARAESGSDADEEDECTLHVGDFDAETAPLCSGSCRWHDVAPERVIAILDRPGRWARHFRPLLEGKMLADGRQVQVFRSKPFARRRVTLDLAVTAAGDGYRVSWSKSRKQEPLDEDEVEVVVYDGWWEVQPDGSGGSIVTHAARFDPGPDFPHRLMRKGMPRQIRRLLRQLRTAVDDAE